MSKESAPVKGFGSFGPSVKIHCQKEQVCRQRKSQEVRSLQITKNLHECRPSGAGLVAKTIKLSVCMELNIGAKNCCCLRRGLQQKCGFVNFAVVWSLLRVSLGR